MPTLFPHQRQGALFLAERRAALLADEQRVGKTAAAITACDYVFARSILVVTKSSARANWGRDFRIWGWPRSIQVVYSGDAEIDPGAEVVVVGWGMVFAKALLDRLTDRDWDAVILDESHEAINTESKRTRAVYGTYLDDGAILNHRGSVCRRAHHVWPLTGTGIPNTPDDLYPMLRRLAPERLQANREQSWPDVTTYTAFRDRYCVTRRKYVGGAWITYAIKGKNENELRERMGGFWLRRTQQDVGIRRPIFSVFALHADAVPRDLDGDSAAVLEAAEAGERIDDMHLGKVRRLTGILKAKAVVEAAREALDNDLDKLVLMAWHTDVIDALREGLAKYGVVGIDGRTPPTKRQSQEQAFQTDRTKRVFVGQIQAAGEAIDLSASAELWFVEPSFVPKDMSQAAMRITNHNQKRQALVRVCALAGSIDEALMEILTRKVATIKQIMENEHAN